MPPARTLSRNFHLSLRTDDAGCSRAVSGASAGPQCLETGCGSPTGLLSGQPGGDRLRGREPWPEACDRGVLVAGNGQRYGAIPNKGRTYALRGRGQLRHQDSRVLRYLQAIGARIWPYFGCKRANAGSMTPCAPLRVSEYICRAGTIKITNAATTDRTSGFS